MSHGCGMSPCAQVHFEPAGALNWEWTAGDALQDDLLNQECFIIVESTFTYAVKSEVDFNTVSWVVALHLIC